MKMKYQFPRLSRSERELLEMILMEEIEIQVWYTVTVSSLMDQELIIPVQ